MLAGFSLLDHGAEPPAWPHIRCAGSGFAWHLDEARRRCFVGEVSVDAPIVAAAIGGLDLPGVDRVLAVARLREASPGSLVRVYRNPCPSCGGNHLERAERALRAARRYLHPGAIPALREACVPEDLLGQPKFFQRGACEMCLRRAPEPGCSRCATCKGRPPPRRSRQGLPVWIGDPERTRAAQIAYAVTYTLRRGPRVGRGER